MLQELSDLAAKADEERKDQFMKQAMRRVANRDLASGFGAWVEMVDAKAYAMSKLREIANRLNPKLRDLASAFYFMREECSEVRQGCREYCALPCRYGPIGPWQYRGSLASPMPT